VEARIRKIKTVPTVILAAVAAIILGRYAGSLLVISQYQPADVIVVLGGDHNDLRYNRGLELLQHAQGGVLFVDSNSDEIQFGEPLTVQSERFIQRTAGNWIEHAHVCPIEGDSTERETEYVARCLQTVRADTVLLVTSAFHTRRALSTFRGRLPQYHWSINAVEDDTRFGEKWWQRREWAKTTFMEWLKMLWWESIDRWRK
jgi:uncharacterized SAM-binding protein YcdF (DUF218 family)